MNKSKGTKHRPSLISWRKRKRMNAQGTPGSQKSWWEVACSVHGMQTAKGISEKRVRVGVPLSKRERMQGCPACKS